MTKVEAYKAVISGEITEDVITKFEEMLTAHELESEKRRNRAAEKRAEKLESEMGLNVQDVKGKSGKVKGYTLA